MNFLVVYCTHQTADLAIREQLAFSSRERLNTAYVELQRRFSGVESVVLSTCNRVELYFAWSENEGPSADAVQQFLADFHQIPTAEFSSELRHESGQAVVRHLFEVVSSLDSMVLGEPQIVSQVKEAYRTAEENAACGPRIHALFQSAIRVSGRVRTETGLAEGRVSIASVAVGDFAKSVFDHFVDKQVLVIGAGEMAEETLRYLKDEGVRDLVVVNRSPERAAARVRMGGRTRSVGGSGPLAGSGGRDRQHDRSRPPRCRPSPISGGPSDRQPEASNHSRPGRPA